MPLLPKRFFSSALLAACILWHPTLFAHAESSNADSFFAPATRSDVAVTDIGVLRSQAASGDARAMLVLGVALRDGVGVIANNREAEHWLSRAGKVLGDEAQFELAILYSKTDVNRAIGIYRKLSKPQFPEAENNLAILYLDHDKRSATAGVALLEKAAQSGLACAQFNLGKLYEDGAIVPQDYGLAVEWFWKAANQNQSQAQNELGSMYLAGLGVPRDYARARHWFELAANSGLGAAANNLGVMYANGEGSEQNVNIAYEWYEKAAKSGSVMAANNVGVALLEGRGVERNVEKGMLWLKKAADHGNADAQYNFRAACHVFPAASEVCAERAISTTSYFQKPGANVLWRAD